jgi:hypothetical protein
MIESLVSEMFSFEVTPPPVEITVSTTDYWVWLWPLIWMGLTLLVTVVFSMIDSADGQAWWAGTFWIAGIFISVAYGLQVVPFILSNRGVTGEFNWPMFVTALICFAGLAVFAAASNRQWFSGRTSFLIAAALKPIGAVVAGVLLMNWILALY